MADPEARGFLRASDPVLARLIDAHRDFRPRAWLDELPSLDGFGVLIFQVIGQQLSVRATRAIVSRLEERFGGHLPSPVSCLRPIRSSSAPAAFRAGRPRRYAPSPSASSTDA